MCLVGDLLVGLVLLCSSLRLRLGECSTCVLLDVYSSGCEERIWNGELGKVRVFVVIVAVIMGLSGRGGSAL